MRILAVDTALTACTVAVSVPQGAPVVRSLAMARGHAETLMPMILDVLAEAGTGIAEIDRFATTTGPGTFTGVRVGVAAIRGFALATGRPAVGLTTLQALAATAMEAGLGGEPFVVAMDARRDEIYAQSFSKGGEALSAPWVGPAEALVAGLDPKVRRVVGSGAGIAAAASDCLEAAGDIPVPSPTALLRLAANAPHPAEAPRPLYLRAPDAKPQTRGRIARQ